MKSEELASKENELKKQLSKTYRENKELFIRAEEKLTQMNFFVAPLLEHRDALDHIMRYFCIKEQEGLSEKALEELNKSLGHELRAYFDIADYVCVTIREEISKKLEKITTKQIKEVWADYITTKKKIVQVSEEIAQIRQNRNGSIEYIEKYKVVLNEIFDIYEQFIVSINPVLIKNRKLFFFF